MMQILSWKFVAICVNSMSFSIIVQYASLAWFVQESRALGPEDEVEWRGKRGRCSAVTKSAGIF